MFKYIYILLFHAFMNFSKNPIFVSQKVLMVNDSRFDIYSTQAKIMSFHIVVFCYLVLTSKAQKNKIINWKYNNSIVYLLW